MFDDLTKRTEKLEDKTVKELKAAYSQAYREMKAKLSDAIADYGKDGKLTNVEMQKYSRLNNLIKSMEKDLGKAESLQSYQLKTYLKNAYELNYYYTGFELETNTLVKLNFGLLDREAVAKSVENPLMNIAIVNNKRETRARIKRSLTQSVVQGEGIQDAAARIKKATNIGLNRSVQIARTETTKVMSQSRQAGFEKAAKKGIKLKKQWVATKDGRTRDSHGDLDGEIVDIDKPFSNGLMYPGGSGPAEEVVNCRCTHVTVIDDVDYSSMGISKTEQLGSYETFDEWKKSRLKR